MNTINSMKKGAAATSKCNPSNTNLTNNITNKEHSNTHNNTQLQGHMLTDGTLEQTQLPLDYLQQAEKLHLAYGKLARRHVLVNTVNGKSITFKKFKSVKSVIRLLSENKVPYNCSLEYLTELSYITDDVNYRNKILRIILKKLSEE